MIRESPYQLAADTTTLLRWGAWDEGPEISPTFLPAVFRLIFMALSRWSLVACHSFKDCFWILPGLRPAGLWLQKLFVVFVIVVVTTIKTSLFVCLSVGVWNHVSSQPGSALKDSSGEGVTLLSLTHLESLDMVLPHFIPNKQKKSKHSGKEPMKATKTERLVCEN